MSISSYAMNHIGISVPDIEAAVVWYRDVLGCFVLVQCLLNVFNNTRFSV